METLRSASHRVAWSDLFLCQATPAEQLIRSETRRTPRPLVTGRPARQSEHTRQDCLQWDVHGRSDKNSGDHEGKGVESQAGREPGAPLTSWRKLV